MSAIGHFQGAASILGIMALVAIWIRHCTDITVIVDIQYSGTVFLASGISRMYPLEIFCSYSVE